MRFFTFIIFFITSLNVFAIERVKSARWSKNLGYGDCNLLGMCSVDTIIRTNTKSASLGDIITINLGDGETTSFKVRRIWKEGSKCWLTPSTKKKYKPWLTVRGCK